MSTRRVFMAPVTALVSLLIMFGAAPWARGPYGGVDMSGLIQVAKVSPCLGCTGVSVPLTIDPTGIADVTDALSQWIASVPQYSTVFFPPGSRYRIEDTILVENKNNLTIEANGAEFFATTPGYRERSHWKFTSGSNITFRNVRIRGANPVAGLALEAYDSIREAQHGVNIKGVSRFLLEGATITDVYGDFVYVSDERGTWASDVTIRNSRLERNGRQGISITGGRNVMIDHNYIGDVRRSVFDLEPFSIEGGAVNVTITANEIGDSRLKFFASGGRAARIENIVVSDNTLNRPLSFYMESPIGSRRNGLQILNNTSTVATNHPPVISLTRVDGIVVTGNSQVFAGKGADDSPAISLTESCATVGANNFLGKTTIVGSDGYSCG